MAMKFFKVTLTSYTDETTDFVIIPKADEYDGDNPVFNEKNLLNMNEFKEFIKHNETPIVNVTYKLYEITETVNGLNFETVLQLESDGKLNLIEENDYVVDSTKLPKGKKKKGGFEIKQYMPVIIIIGAAVLLLIIASSFSKTINNNIPVEENTTTVVETSIVETIVSEVTTTAVKTTVDTVTSVSTVSDTVEITTTTAVVPEILDDISVHFIDVGQGDCIYADLPNDVGLLIDSGTTDSSEDVVNYLSNMGLTDIDYVIATHPHEDHIGGMSNIIQSFTIGEFIMPELTENMTPTTECYLNMLTALEEAAVQVSYSELGMEYEISENCSFQIIAPIKDYELLNDYSIVVKLTYGDTSYLFTGDIENSAEYDILKSDYIIDSDVLKVAHHGSDTSSMEEFVSTVTPKISIISVGSENEYGHPMETVTERLATADSEIIRTDESGTVIIKSDGVGVWAEFPYDEPVIESTTTPTTNSGGGSSYTSGSYKISFNANGGKGEINPITATGGFKVTLPTEGFTREGYEFIGWTQSTDIKYPLYSFTMPEYDTILYAVWEPKEYTVTYNSNGGLGLVVPYKVKVDEEVPLPVEGLTNGDLILAGWNTNPDSKSSLKKMFMPNKDITLYAVWAEPNSQAKITLVADGQESSFTYEIGEELNCRDDFGITKDGYIVSGWTLYDGYGDVLQTFTVRGDTTLYATWEAATYITITIDQSHLNKKAAKISVALDMNGVAKYELPIVDTERNHRKGYTYGWSTEKNGYIEYYGGEIAEFEKPTTVYRVRNMYGGGNGTEENPYLIKNWEHIELMSEIGVSGYYKQVSDIEMPSNYTHTSINVIKPTEATDNLMYNHFIYDGSGHKIVNLKSNGGLFNELCASKVKNLIIEHAIIITDNKSTDKIGIIANAVLSETFTVTGNKTFAMNNSEIIGCKISDSAIEINSKTEYVGSVVGYGGDICDTYITNVTINVNETATYVGGIAGTAGEIYSCVITGINIEGKSNNSANITYIGGIAANGMGIGLARKGGSYNYIGCDIYDVAVRNAVFLNAEYIGGMLGISGGRTNNPKVTRCYLANAVMNGKYAGSIIGAEGAAAMPHTISYCIIDDTNQYSTIGALSGEKSTTALGAQIVQVPFNGLMIDGVTYILGDKWIRDSNLNDGYIFPEGVKNLLIK